MCTECVHACVLCGVTVIENHTACKFDVVTASEYSHSILTFNDLLHDHKLLKLWQRSEKMINQLN